MSTLKLFGTEHCHLCEQAARLLEANQLSAEKIDICSDDTLYARYEVRIPVLLRCDTEVELAWPFDQHTLLEFIND